MPSDDIRAKEKLARAIGDLEKSVNCLAKSIDRLLKKVETLTEQNSSYYQQIHEAIKAVLHREKSVPLAEGVKDLIAISRPRPEPEGGSHAEKP